MQHDDPLELPSLQFRRVGLRLQGAQSVPESFDFDAHDSRAGERVISE